MGEPVGPEYTAGNLCTTCWGPDKAFGDVPTPKYAAIHISGLVGIWAPANKKWIGQQDEWIVCIWAFEDETFRGYYYFMPAATRLHIEFKPDGEPFLDFDSGLCDDGWSN